MLFKVSFIYKKNLSVSIRHKRIQNMNISILGKISNLSYKME